MPSLDVSELNIVIAVLGMYYMNICDPKCNQEFVGAFIVGYGFISVKIKQVWYLGEARESKLTPYSITSHSCC